MLHANRAVLAEHARKHRLPMMCADSPSVEAGCLMAYSGSLLDMFRRAATHVDKILKGAKPGNLPIEQPTKFELVINLKTAKALGLTIPPALNGRRGSFRVISGACPRSTKRSSLRTWREATPDGYVARSSRFSRPRHSRRARCRA